MNWEMDWFKRSGIILLIMAGLLLDGSLKAGPLVILNKYNVVDANQFLKGGKFDPAFGNAPVAGNGGSWFELLVVGSNPQSLTPEGTTVDMRGWTLEWKSIEWQSMDWQTSANSNAIAGNDPKTFSGALKLTEDPLWQNIRSGTIITFTANNAQQGGKDTDVDFNPTQGKWNINIWAGEKALVKTKGDPLDTTERHWQITIKDLDNKIIFGPVGDGASVKPHSRPNEVFKLQEVEVETVTNAQTAHYKAGGTSTFGQPNVWHQGTNGIFAEDVSILRAWAQQGQN